MKAVKNNTVRGYQGKPLIFEDHDAHLDDLIRVLINSMPTGTVTYADSQHATRLWVQLEAATNGVLPIEDAEWDWLLTKLGDDHVGAVVFAQNVFPVRETLRAAEIEAGE